MNFKSQKKQLFAFFFLAFMLASVGISKISYAADGSILLAPFTYNVSNSYMQTLGSFAQELTDSLEDKGFNVVKTSTKPQSTESAQALAFTNKTNAIIYGTFSQIGDTVAVNAIYVNSIGKSKPINIEVKTNTLVAGIADEIALRATQTGDIDPISFGSISDVQIVGVKVLDPELILSRMTLRRGDIPTTEGIDADVRKIWDTGFFNDVAMEVVEQNGEQVLVVKVEERPRIEEVVVNGSDAVSLSDILETMTSRTGDVLNYTTLSNDIQRVTELYRKKGYYNVEVDYSVSELANGTAVLVFDVNEGNKLYIEEIVFDGIENLDTDELEKYLALKTRGFFSFVTGSGILKEEDLARDAQTVAAFAVNEGYIQAQVSTPEVTYGEEGIIITYKINEGDRFALGDIVFAGNLIEDPAKFYEIIALDEWKEENTYFSLNTMQDDIRALTTYYNDQGFAFAEVAPMDNVDVENKVINITFNIKQNERVHINRVEVSGNYETRDNVILREMRLADGDMFSGSDIARSRERLMKSGYFDKVNIDVQPTENPALVDLNVEVEEGSTGAITGGVGYSTYDGVGVSASISQNNLFGRGYKAGLEGYVSEKEMNMTASFWNPRLYNTNLGAGVSLYGIDQEWIDYDRSTLGAQFSFGYPLGEYTTLNWGYRIENYEITEVDELAAPSIKEYEGNNWASVVTLGVTRDTTDVNFFATKGTKTKITLNYGGNFLGGDDNFFRVLGEFGAYYSPVENHVLHGRVSVGGVFKNTSKVVPSFERFYIGGMNSIRGYSYEDISPIDPSTGESIGADRVAYASLEYIWIFENDLGLALVPFFDAGVATDSSYESFFERHYYSVGAEIRWRSPMGDLRFAYGFPLTDNVKGEKRSSGRMEFTIGQAF